MRFSESSQNSMFEKSIFGHFEVVFLILSIFSRAAWLFPVSTFEAKYFHEKLSSLAGPKKKLFSFPKKY